MKYDKCLFLFVLTLIMTVCVSLPDASAQLFRGRFQQCQTPIYTVGSGCMLRGRLRAGTARILNRSRCWRSGCGCEAAPVNSRCEVPVPFNHFVGATCAPDTGIALNPFTTECSTCEAVYVDGFWRITRYCTGQDCYCSVPQVLVSGSTEFECVYLDPGSLQSNQLPDKTCFLGLSCNDAGKDADVRILFQVRHDVREPFRFESRDWIVIGEFSELRVPVNPVNILPKPKDMDFATVSLKGYSTYTIPFSADKPVVFEIGRWSLTVTRKSSGSGEPNAR